MSSLGEEAGRSCVFEVLRGNLFLFEGNMGGEIFSHLAEKNLGGGLNYVTVFRGKSQWSELGKRD